jgi:hypothetical protein
MSKHSWNEGFQEIFEFDCEAMPCDPNAVPEPPWARPSTEAILGAIPDLIERDVVEIEAGGARTDHSKSSEGRSETQVQGTAKTAQPARWIARNAS